MSDNNQIDEGRSPVAGTGRQNMTMGTKIALLALVGVVELGFVSVSYTHLTLPTKRIV